MRPIRSKAILQAARGEMCCMQTPLCNRDPETTVAAHSNSMMHGKSMARKADDIFVTFACSDCHQWLDTSGADRDERLYYFARGHAKTLERLVELGVIKVQGFEP